MLLVGVTANKGRPVVETGVGGGVGGSDSLHGEGSKVNANMVRYKIELGHG